MDVPVEVVLNQRGIQIFFDPSVKVRIDCLYVVFIVRRKHRDLIGDNIALRVRFRYRFRLRFVRISRDISTQGHYAFVPILTDTYVFQTGLIKGLANVITYVRSPLRVVGART